MFDESGDFVDEVYVDEFEVVQCGPSVNAADNAALFAAQPQLRRAPSVAPCAAEQLATCTKHTAYCAWLDGALGTSDYVGANCTACAEKEKWAYDGRGVFIGSAKYNYAGDAVVPPHARGEGGRALPVQVQVQVPVR